MAAQRTRRAADRVHKTRPTVDVLPSHQRKATRRIGQLNNHAELDTRWNPESATGRSTAAPQEGGRNRHRYLPGVNAPVRLKTAADFAGFATRIVDSIAAWRLDEESGLIMFFGVLVAARLVAFRDGSRLPPELAEMGQRAERLAYQQLMKIADKSSGKLEGLAPIALRLIDTIDPRQVHRRRWESRRTPRIRRAAANPSASEQADAARRAKEKRWQEWLR